MQDGSPLSSSYTPTERAGTGGILMVGSSKKSGCGDDDDDDKMSERRDVCAL